MVKSLTKHRFVTGVCTTSRVEGLHRVLQESLNSHSRLTELFQTFKNIESLKLEKYKEEFNRHSKKKRPIAMFYCERTFTKKFSLCY